MAQIFCFSKKTFFRCENRFFRFQIFQNLMILEDFPYINTDITCYNSVNVKKIIKNPQILNYSKYVFFVQKAARPADPDPAW